MRYDEMTTNEKIAYRLGRIDAWNEARSMLRDSVIERLSTDSEEATDPGSEQDQAAGYMEVGEGR